MRKVNAPSSKGSVSAAPSFSNNMFKPRIMGSEQSQSQAGSQSVNNRTMGFNSVRNNLNKGQPRVNQTPKERMTKQTSGFSNAVRQESRRKPAPSVNNNVAPNGLPLVDDEYLYEDPDMFNKLSNRMTNVNT